jgi:hypothetical protein
MGGSFVEQQAWGVSRESLSEREALARFGRHDIALLGGDSKAPRGQPPPRLRLLYSDRKRLL